MLDGGVASFVAKAAPRSFSGPVPESPDCTALALTLAIIVPRLTTPPLATKDAVPPVATPPPRSLTALLSKLMLIGAKVPPPRIRLAVPPVAFPAMGISFSSSPATPRAPASITRPAAESCDPAAPTLTVALPPNAFLAKIASASASDALTIALPETVTLPKSAASNETGVRTSPTPCDEPPSTTKLPVTEISPEFPP